MPAASATVPKYWAIVPAAGSGRRMAAEVPKQYLPLQGITVLEHTLNVLFACESIEGVVLALSPEDNYWTEIAPRYAGKNLACVAGGDERCHSVLNALHHLRGFADTHDWVLVHDAARPCVRVDDVTALIETLADDACGGLLGVPVADTMKRLGTDDRVAETVDRQVLWHAQTPQMFRLGLLQAALEQALAQGRLVTDEAAAMEMAGHRPCMVRGHPDNIKITVSTDLALAEFFLQGRP
ncbi:MAG: 2-C-methyl-D-erythritol 4-phosphate cytidylyltransferase [Gammaproteobacteria bacterium]